MSRAEANKEYNSFVAGLITEASPLTYPENASIDEENFLLSRRGFRRRRLGMDYETGYVLTDTGLSATTFSTQAISTFEWKSINGDGTLGLLITQIGNRLYFYDLFSSAASAIPKNGGAYITLDNSPEDKVQFVSIIGGLIITTGSTKISTLEYDKEKDSITLTSRNLYTRDLFGVDDGLGTSTRPTTLSDTHKYNLLNQGWTIDNIINFSGHQGVYPSNADVMHRGKDANGNFDDKLLVKQNFGSTPAAKGRNILDIFGRGDSRNSGGYTPRSTTPFEGTFLGLQEAYRIFPNFSPIVPLPLDSTLNGCTTVAQYAGRVFYSGAGSDLVSPDSKSPNLGGYVFFSQVVESLDKVNLCYQEADPTSEYISDIIDSDGGSIIITEARNIIKLVPIAGGITVFASNGVWEITGGDIGFSATSFQVIKVSDIGAISPSSIVAVDSAVFYWAKAGIYVLQPDKASGRLVSSNISETTIQTLYNSIDRIIKNNVVGIYDDVANQVRWLYTSDALYDGLTNRFKFNKELIFDITLKAFYKYTIKSLDVNSPSIAAYINIEDVITSDITLDVISGSDDVITADGLDVVSGLTVFGRGVKSIKYLTIVPETTIKFTVGLYNNIDFMDWSIKDGVGKDAIAFLLTGFDTFQDTQRSKKVTYITTHMKFTETGFDASIKAIGESSCKMQAQWEWANSANSGRWSSEQQIYRKRRNYIASGAGDPFDYGFEVITARSKLRGKGRALSLKFTTEINKDCVLLGWALNITGETKV